MNGLVVYAETENAIMPSHLEDLGLDIRRRFVYADPSCTEDVFKIAEDVIVKSRAAVERRGMPILFVWDSVAATSPKAELEGDYDKDTIGLQARTISKCLRKVTGIVGCNSVTFIALNQLRTKVGVMYGDPLVTPGGNAIPFHSSVRLRLGSGMKLVDKDKNQYGIKVIATTLKNKVARPGRKVEFEIHFGRGIVEHEQILDVIRARCKEGPIVRGDKDLMIEGEGGWKTLTVSSHETGEVYLEKKFTKNDFANVLKDPDFTPIIAELLEGAMVVGPGDPIRGGSTDDSAAPAAEMTEE
jgi:protein RecA